MPMPPLPPNLPRLGAGLIASWLTQELQYIRGIVVTQVLGLQGKNKVYVFLLKLGPDPTLGVALGHCSGVYTSCPSSLTGKIDDGSESWLEIMVGLTLAYPWSLQIPEGNTRVRRSG
jgi:hypothetical protein